MVDEKKDMIDDEKAEIQTETEASIAAETEAGLEPQSESESLVTAADDHADEADILDESSVVAQVEEPQLDNKEPQQDSKKPQPVNKKQSQPLWLPAAVIVFLLVGGGAAGGFWYLNKQIVQLKQSETVDPLSMQDQGARADLAALQAQVSQMAGTLQSQQRLLSNQKAPEDIGPLKKQMADLKQQIQSANGDRTAVQEQLAQLQARVDGHQNRFISLTATSREDWKLAEAEYLLKLANQRVLLERSPINAIALLEATDEIIKEVADGLGDPELFAIRKALSKELTALRLVMPVDREGIYLELEALADESELFNVHRGSPFLAQDKVNAPELKVADDQQGWWAKIKSLAPALNQYIRVQPQDSPENPLIGVYESQLKTLNLRILIQQSQVALLKEQPSVYQSGLARAQTLIQNNFADTEIAAPFLARLQALSEKPIAQDLPDISKSLKLLHGYIARTHQLSTGKVSAL